MFIIFPIKKLKFRAYFPIVQTHVDSLLEAMAATRTATTTTTTSSNDSNVGKTIIYCFTHINSNQIPIRDCLE